ncbi:hypothetical protein [Clostridium tetani]|nr:hypothetical protein [Clostridium tetani]
MKIQDVHLDYIKGIILFTLIFGSLGIALSNFLKKKSIVNKNKRRLS